MNLVFSTTFCPIEVDLAKLTVFGIFNEVLSTQNVKNLAILYETFSMIFKDCDKAFRYMQKIRNQEDCSFS